MIKGTKKVHKLLRKTHLLDADGKTVGELAVKGALLLRGKGKVSFLPYKDNGDFVKIVNAKKLKFTGNKFEAKKFFRFTGYIGHLKSETLREKMAKDPVWVVRHAVLGMLPKNRLRSRIIKRLSVYADEAK